MGRADAEALGAELRRRYAAALGMGGDGAGAGPEAMVVRSSNIQRTIATATAVLSGLFPERSSGAEPVHIRVASDDAEWLFPNFECCPRLRQMCKDYGGAGDLRNPARLEAWRRAWAPQLARLANALPEPLVAPQSPWAVVELLDHCAARHAHGLPPLGAMTQAELADVREIAFAVVADLFTGALRAPDLPAAQRCLRCAHNRRRRRGKAPRGRGSSTVRRPADCRRGWENGCRCISHDLSAHGVFQCA